MATITWIDRSNVLHVITTPNAGAAAALWWGLALSPMVRRVRWWRGARLIA